MYVRPRDFPLRILLLMGFVHFTHSRTHARTHAETDPDYAKLQEAKKVIEAVCEYIDASLNDYVHQVRLKEIDASFTGRPEVSA